MASTHSYPPTVDWATLLSLSLPSQSSPHITPSSRRHLHIILNPSAGANSAPTFVSEAVIPILNLVGISYTIHETKAIDHAAEIGAELVQGAKGELNIAVGGGDGTTHELVNGILLHGGDGSVISPLVSVNLIILPLGTANALYYHLFPPESPLTPTGTPISSLYSLRAFILNSSPPAPLPLALNTLPTSPKSVITTVVTSFALHASILHDAEALRSTVPGLERFKVAAAQNASNWYEGTLVIKDGVKKYDRDLKEFVEVPGKVSIEGPFSYLVSSLVSRFEPTFIVAPSRTSSSAAGQSSLDIILIKPLSDPDTKTLASKGKQGVERAQNEFVGKLWGVMGGMYQGGKHIENELVEYWRVGSFDWKPASESNLKSRLACLDGALRDLGEGGEIRTKALSVEETRINVWS